jgi:type I restriction enzyme M protein
MANFASDARHREADIRNLLKGVSGKVINFLMKHDGKDIPDFIPVLEDSKELEKDFGAYNKAYNPGSIEKTNKAQRDLNQKMQPFFATMHELLKAVDKKVRKIEKKKNRQRM